VGNIEVNNNSIITNKMKTKTIFIVLGILLIGMMIFGSFKTGKAVKEDVNGDSFKGVITNMKLEPQTLDGRGVYDKTCNMVEDGLTQCNAGIQTEEGLLDFSYKHHMDVQKCIADGDNLQVEILEGGEAIVTRI